MMKAKTTKKPVPAKPEQEETTPRHELDNELAATVLLEAAYTTDEKAALRYDVGVRSIQRWRARLATDPVLVGVIATKKRALDAAWADELPIALRKGITLIGESCDAIREDKDIRKSPDVMKAVAGAIMICADVMMTNKVIDARIAQETGPADDVPRPLPPPSEEDFYLPN